MTSLATLNSLSIILMMAKARIWYVRLKNSMMLVWWREDHEMPLPAYFDGNKHHKSSGEFVSWMNREKKHANSAELESCLNVNRIWKALLSFVVSDLERKMTRQLRMSLIAAVDILWSSRILSSENWFDNWMIGTILNVRCAMCDSNCATSDSLTFKKRCLERVGRSGLEETEQECWSEFSRYLKR